MNAIYDCLKKAAAILPVVCITFSRSFSQTGPPVAHQIIDGGIIPEVFAPGVVSTPFTEWSTSFSPDGKTVYSSQGAIYWTIIYSQWMNGKWGKPQVAPFSGKFRDTDPFVTPDGKKLFFVSSRPLEGEPQDKPRRNLQLWYVDRLTDGGWSQPYPLDTIVNASAVSNFAPSISKKGTLYFCSRDRNGHSGMSSYYSEWQGGHYGQPQLITFKGFDEIQDPFISPDERYLMFVSGSDIYITYRNSRGWSDPEKLPVAVNNGDGNSSPYVSPDGKTLYYSSPRWQGFYKRDQVNHTADYSDLERENGGLFNNQPNILMIPVHIPVSTQ